MIIVSSRKVCLELESLIEEFVRDKLKDVIHILTFEKHLFSLQTALHCGFSQKGRTMGPSLCVGECYSQDKVDFTQPWGLACLPYVQQAPLCHPALDTLERLTLTVSTVAMTECMIRCCMIQPNSWG